VDHNNAVVHSVISLFRQDGVCLTRGQGYQAEQNSTRKGLVSGARIEKPMKTGCFFKKTDKISSVWFCRFIENQSVEFEIKNPKNISLYLKNIDENRIQKYIAFHPEKNRERCHRC
jgi:hypothetical protein